MRKGSRGSRVTLPQGDRCHLSAFLCESGLKSEFWSLVCLPFAPVTWNWIKQMHGRLHWQKVKETEARTRWHAVTMRNNLHHVHHWLHAFPPQPTAHPGAVKPRRGRQLSAGVFWFRRTSLLPFREPSSAGWEPPSAWPHTGVSAVR